MSWSEKVWKRSEYFFKKSEKWHGFACAFFSLKYFKKSLKQMTWISLWHFFNWDTAFTSSGAGKWGPFRHGVYSRPPGVPPISSARQNETVNKTMKRYLASSATTKVDKSIKNTKGMQNNRDMRWFIFGLICNLRSQWTVYKWNSYI